MAFYTSRVDDNGTEIERRPSARSLTSPLSSNFSRSRLSSRSNLTSSSSSVRYVNSAAYIEKNPPDDNLSAYIDKNSPDNYMISDKNPMDQNDDTSSIGDEVSRYVTVSEGDHSDIVPPLDLISEENFPTTTRDYTYSLRKHCEAAKSVLKPDLAYETWLSAKRKVISDEAARRKKLEEQKQKEKDERKRLADEKYQQWLQSKKTHETRSREKISKTTSENEVTKQKSQRTVSDEVAQLKMEQWERTKKLEDERRRLIKKQEEQRRRLLEEERRHLAADAWKKWLADADKKPKPVPLNRGIFTLRGTISDIYVNPNEWKSIASTEVEK